MEKIDIERVLKVRGYLGNVKNFQKSRGLTADGIVGPKTTAALLDFPKKGMMNTAQKMQRYGEPGQVEDFEMIDLPFALRISWDLGKKVTRIQCHKRIAARLKRAFQEILDVYGLAEIQRLGIDLFGGCFNYRKMRGGSSWSSHAWAIAIDLDPERNQLRETAATARFARPDYAAMILIFYKHGFVSQGVEKDFDWMHFEDAP